ncbi:ADYC domain-containing protein [Mesorhizobium sp. YC-39]|uniref:ADYC domain-containing protein n=1 Tax=unclassified Mesorhizobium TaxID=325217 RepID=UPI0021E71172|nr:MULTISPECIES: ADYC domain-containing protein [unclassified Mesorhizobium]MCV3209027.1 ADYC domain-containing protein [Mesorhizobium sp. YC-2]MCV3231623.1 ADYC domain-containing protein [Mesorhizobium sp. YC-39]
MVAIAAAVSSMAVVPSVEAGSGQEISSISVVGTRFEVTTDDGRIVPQNDLVGAVLTIGDGNDQVPLRIDAVETDPHNLDGAIMLYAMSSRDAATGEWRNICEPDIEGRRMGFPLAGTWTPDGRHLPSDTAFSITCTGGAQAKCVRFGYRPWEKSADGTSLWDHHQACTRMIRADYCGDGVGHTRNGTPIVIYDRKGIQQDEAAPDMSFEAAWGVGGALCVSHTRIRDVLTMEGLARICPDVRQLPQTPACESQAGALILNRSIDQSGRHTP